MSALCYIPEVPECVRFNSVNYSYPHSHAPALSDVSFSVPRGSLFALLGPNGAGKTTLLRLLCGRFLPASGSIAVPEQWKDARGVLDAHHYGVLLENPGVYPKLSIEEYLLYFAGFYEVKNIRGRIAELAVSFELPDVRTRLSALSLGNKQKVQIARALLHRPELLILDEPVANLDPLARELVWNFLRELHKNEGVTVILCSHVLAEMDGLATDYAMIGAGKILRAGAVKTFSSGPAAVEMELGAAVPGSVSDSLRNISRSVRLTEQGISYVADSPESQNPRLVAALVAGGVPVISVNVRRGTLAQLYSETFGGAR